MIKSKQWLLDNLHDIGADSTNVKNNIVQLTLARPKLGHAIMSGEYVCLPPGMVHELISIEEMQVPSKTVAFITLIPSLISAGLIMSQHYLPSYYTENVAVTVFAGAPIELKIGAPFLNVMFLEVEN